MIYLVTYIQLFVFEQACTLFVKFTALSICLSFICYIFTRHQLVGTVFLARYAWVRFVRLFVGLWIRSSVPQNPLTSSKDHFVIPGTGMFAVHRTADIIVIVCNVTVLYLISWLDKDVLIWYIPNVLAPVIKLSRMFTCLYCRMLNNLAATSLISDSDQSGQRCREWK